jgi:hypothetical protein
MKMLHLIGTSAVVSLTEHELMILANSINETREAIEEWEFETRVGASSAEAELLHQQIKAIGRKMKSPSDR